jgi:hypothetical protein
LARLHALSPHVQDALSIVGRIGDMALDPVLIYVVFRLTYVVWRLQRAIRVGTSKLEHFFTENRNAARPHRRAGREALKQPSMATKGVREDYPTI